MVRQGHPALTSPKLAHKNFSAADILLHRRQHCNQNQTGSCWYNNTASLPWFLILSQNAKTAIRKKKKIIYGIQGNPISKYHLAQIAHDTCTLTHAHLERPA